MPTEPEDGRGLNPANVVRRGRGNEKAYNLVVGSPIMLAVERLPYWIGKGWEVDSFRSSPSNDVLDSQLNGPVSKSSPKQKARNLAG